ncbi:MULTISPECIES: phage baseplate plug family protein [unclassified Pantoea]|uniref:phage baseplate plug family protein n=1 Tax=unclassified Pantoea TaxID=2630326 RepID=UPI00206DEF9D|nr:MULTISPECIES: hypothetical protein [unclassified Pantoea]MDU5474026.1 hypothetical protein [Pantoea sp.]DAI70384.1 MAG TPA: hypothetical protein [Bacteriophage sp.]
MAIQEIPLTADNQQFSISIAGTTYQVGIIWRDTCWVMDLQRAGGDVQINGIPLVTGVDLLAQHAYLGLGFSLYVICDVSAQDYPTQTDLGSRSHLLVLTEQA